MEARAPRPQRLAYDAMLRDCAPAGLGVDFSKPLQEALDGPYSLKLQMLTFLEVSASVLRSAIETERLQAAQLPAPEEVPTFISIQEAGKLSGLTFETLKRRFQEKVWYHQPGGHRHKIMIERNEFLRAIREIR